MKSTIDLLQAKKERELRKIRSKNSKYFDQYKREESFVARLPYPLQIGDIINIIERMGIVQEKKILPELYKIQRKVDVHLDE
ncbi:hypothetical protein N9U79_01775 [Alphaproteobacteria bacterium]|nr:hypothetical protein [Alphaproteobacteria bacterium]|tara:strand:+ start:4620 stop:4865 length:246 start_codon:yes stop_codon:yes gene_type:complete